MTLDAKRCEELIYSDGKKPISQCELIDQLSAALELLRYIGNTARNLRSEHPAWDDIADKLTEAGL